MRYFAKLVLLLAITVAVEQPCAHGQAALTTVAFDSGSQTVYNTNKSTPLTAGTAAPGDGAVLQLGYFSTATTASLFSGTFIPLSGMGSANTAYSTTSIGDDTAQGAGTGTFALTLSFTSGSAVNGNNLPAAGTPLAILYYNNTTIASSTAYGVASDAAWTFQTPAAVPNSPTVNISFDDNNIKFFQNIGTAPVNSVGGVFYTGISTVPEPSSLLSGCLVCVGMLGLMYRGKIAVRG